MNIKLNKEEDLLDINYRIAVIEEINGEDNIARKAEMKKRHEVYKDLTSKYVLELVKEEQGDDAYKEILNRVSNLSIAKKIINKKSGIYSNGVIRQVIDDNDGTSKVEIIEDELELNVKFKKVNRYVELFKNTTAQIIPWLNQVDGKYQLLLNVLSPYKYDVIPDHANHEYARVYITSYEVGKYEREGMEYVQPGEEGKRDNITVRQGKSCGQKYNTEIYYVWWSNIYHFTTDSKGNIVAGLQEDNLLNPIGQLPFVNYAMNQDGEFWAIGGADVVDGSILINLILSDMYYIAKFQGLGLGYLFGKGIPKNIKIGPSAFISMEVQEGDPTPQIGFANANPPIADHMAMTDQYVALLLATNNLAPGTIQGALSATNAQSGVQEMVRNADVIEESEDKRDMYLNNEYKIFKIVQEWYRLLADKQLLSKELQEIGSMPEDLEINVKFKDAKAMTTETEKLDIIKRRRETGLDTMVDAIILDNPDISIEEAEKKLMELKAEKLKESREVVMNNVMGKTNEQKSDDNFRG